MTIHKKFFPKVLSDNELAYFAHLEGLLNSLDEYCSVEVIKKPHSYYFRIAASVPMYNSLLITELLKFHNQFNIRLNMSKSIKTSSSIVFEIIFG